MSIYNKRSQIITVGIIHIFLIGFYLFTSLYFWGEVCQGEFLHCIKDAESPYGKVFFLSIFRPFFLMPLFVFSFMNAATFSLRETFFLNLLSSFISVLSVSFLAKYFGRHYVKPWLDTNFPNTFYFINRQDYWIILLTRLIPIFPFDVCTFAYGLLDFKLWKIIFWSFIGYTVEAFFLSLVGSSMSPFAYLFLAVLPVALIVLLIFFYIIFHFLEKPRKALMANFNKMKEELKKELELTRTIVRRGEFDKRKKPVLLLYGFFSSRSTLTNLERILYDRGYEVLSFNLGGLLEVFFTRGVIDAASHLDQKLQELFKLYDFKELNIVAHSKGGLVAFWWLNKLGGYQYCSKLITLGTPFRGTYWVWLALVTPLGFFFRDLWEMRPGSSFLKYMNQFELPKNFKLYSFYSSKDHVVRGSRALLKNYIRRDNLEVIPMHHVGHFGYVHRKDIGDTLVKILASPYYEKKD